MICYKCKQEYDENDDLNDRGKHTEDWLPADGRCYMCYLEFLYDIFGGYLEPCFFVGELVAMADGVQTKTEFGCYEPDPVLPESPPTQHPDYPPEELPF